MLKLSKAMNYVMNRAAAEAVIGNSQSIHPVHAFLGLLKLAEKPPEDIISDSIMEIRMVKTILQKQKIETSLTRFIIRKVISDRIAILEDDGQKQIAMILAKANRLAEDIGQKVIPADIVLKLIIDNPHSLIRDICKLDVKKSKPELKAIKSSGNAEQDGEGQDNDTSGRRFIVELTEKARKLRHMLLGTLFGQDHAVHAFAEGVFNSELLAHADEKRKQPSAIFVFAGPPGVGKTFLAEQAAKNLSLPFKRFDMSNFSDHQQHIDLVGFSPSYKAAKEGLLTGFVKKNPKSVLLFDEIEKAHLNCIQLFLQILDTGTLQDKFSEENVMFRDTIIIFTTNAGRQLYEDKTKSNNAGIPRQTILNALETDIHPNTGRPFFPAAICSRLATGWPIMFNHLQVQDLEHISRTEFRRSADLFEKQYDIKISEDALLATVLLFSEGGGVDARTLRAQSEIFFKNEIFKLCRLFNKESFEQTISKIKSIYFRVDEEDVPAETADLFKNNEKPEILLFCSNDDAKRCHKEMPGYIWHDTMNPETALELLGENNIRLVLLHFSQNFNDATGSCAFDGTIQGFDYIPMAASGIQPIRSLFRKIRERLPEIPVYLLESPENQVDEELEMTFVRGGARGKMLLPDDILEVFEEELNAICRRLHLQTMAANMAAEQKVLRFETAPKLDLKNGNVTIRLRDFSLKRAISADDNNDVLDEVEKPSVRFNDVIGADGAKDELTFFIDYLKNPKKFTAQDLKVPKGVLLYGPPGTGKTMLAKAMAGESDVAFIPAVASSFVTKWQGSGPESIRNLFKKARRYAPSIVFIDEIDAIGRARGGGNTGHGEEMALNALLTEMDGFSVDPKRPVFILAATNFEVEEAKGGIGQIDAALTRRFDRKILVDLPDKAARKKYLELKLDNRNNCEVTPKMIEHLAGRSTGMSLAHMEAVIELAARMATKKSSPLTDSVIEQAFELTKHGEEKVWGTDYLERVARHEAGHAYMYWRAGNTPAYLTIVARGGHGGYMEHAENENSSPLKTKDQLIENIRTSLAGRAAETVYYGEKDGLSTGVSGDLEGATRLAQAMICNYGMDEEFGLIALSAKDANRGPLAAKINERISTILKAEMIETVNIISKAKTPINKLVKKLLDKNRLTGEEINSILGDAVK